MREIQAGLLELDRVVKAMEERIVCDAIISLKGDLAAGKTTLVQAIAAHRSEEMTVTSPTFSLQHSYAEDLHHYDLYRIDFEEMVRLGLLEELERPGWHLVEWADERLKDFLSHAGYTLWEVEILPLEEGKRIYRIGHLDA